jgi:hypothetical protein
MSSPAQSSAEIHLEPAASLRKAAPVLELTTSFRGPRLARARDVTPAASVRYGGRTALDAISSWTLGAAHGLRRLLTRARGVLVFCLTGLLALAFTSFSGEAEGNGKHNGRAPRVAAAAGTVKSVAGATLARAQGSPAPTHARPHGKGGKPSKKHHRSG